MNPRHKAHPWQVALAEATGQWAFVLTLSRRMVNMLSVVKHADFPGLINSNAHGTFHTMQSLERRGLVRFELKIGTPFGGKWVLTPAGKCALKLLEYAAAGERK